MFFKALTLFLALFSSVGTVADKTTTKTGTVVMMSSFRLGANNASLVSHEYYANIECPFVPSPDNYAIQIPDPECDIPLQTFYEGREARRFQRRSGVFTGDKITFKLDSGPEEEQCSAQTRAFPFSIAATPSKYKIKDVAVVSKSRHKEYFTGQPIRLRSIVYLLDVCNLQNPFRSPSEYMKYISQNVPGSSGAAMQKIYNTCSYGKTFFNPEDSIVIGPINVGCNGTLFRGSLRYDYSWNRCGAAEQFWWSDFAEAHARNLSSNNAQLRSLLEYTPGRRALVLLPRGTRCPWAGVAPVGCATSRCVLYIKGEYLDKVPIVFHEMQHTMGLSHATFNRQEYGDRSCPMGRAEETKPNAFVCHNAPNMYRLGWASAIRDLNTDTMSVGTPLVFVLPATSTSDKNYVRVDTGLTTYRNPVYFISYRAANLRSGYDAGLQNDLNRKVFVHIYNGTISSRDLNRSAVITWGDANTRFAGAPAAAPQGLWMSPELRAFGVLSLKVLSVDETQASVQLCKVAGGGNLLC